jgi:hypothetical protein
MDARAQQLVYFRCPPSLLSNPTSVSVVLPWTRSWTEAYSVDRGSVRFIMDGTVRERGRHKATRTSRSCRFMNFDSCSCFFQQHTFEVPVQKFNKKKRKKRKLFQLISAKTSAIVLAWQFLPSAFAFFYSAENKPTKLNISSKIISCSSSTTNPVYERRVNLLVCSLPSHRHSYSRFYL